VSDTLHHRKPGTPRSPRKRYLNTGRANTQLRMLMASLDDTLDTVESMSVRRTR